MTLYKHTYPGEGRISMQDSKGVNHNLNHGESCTIDRMVPGNGVVIEDVAEKPKSSKKQKGEA